MNNLLFVGEKRSDKAIAMGVTWRDGRLCSRTLHAALDACGIDGTAQAWVNAFKDGEGWQIDEAAISLIRERAQAGLRIVGLGRRVQGLLEQRGIPHLKLTHPAARGAIRRRDVYHSHVAAVLLAPAA